MTEPIRVFVNGQGVAVPPGSTVLEAVAAVDANLAAEVRGGMRAIVDSRGLAVEPETSVHGGFVMRVVSARPARDPEA